MGVTKRAQAWIDGSAKRLVDVVARLVLLFLSSRSWQWRSRSRAAAASSSGAAGSASAGAFQMLKFRKRKGGYCPSRQRKMSLCRLSQAKVSDAGLVTA